MKIKNRIRVLVQAYTHSKNKKTIFKKIIKSFLKGGLAGLKYDILGVARRQVNIDDIYEVQQRLALVATEIKEYITVIIEIPTIDTDISGTIESLNGQIYKNYYVKLIAPIEYDKHKEYDITYFKKFPGEVYKTVIDGINSVYFIILNGSNILDKDALNRFAMSITDKAELTYCDECIFDGQDGRRINYFIKPAYSEIYNTLSMYIEQGVMFLTEKAKEITHFFDENISFSARMGDAVFKTLQVSKHINHIERILLLRNSFAENNNILQKMSIMERNLERINIKGSVYFKDNLMHLASVQQNFKVSIIIPYISFNRNNYEGYINSILINTDYPDYEIIAVSSDETISEIYRVNNISKVKVVTDKEQDSNYSRMWNLGAKFATGDILLFLNNTVKVEEKDWLEEIVQCFVFKKVGAVSPKILREDNTIQYAGTISGGFGLFPIPFNGDLNVRKEGFNDYAFISREISILSATCIAVRKQIFSEINGFNEVDTPNKFSNADLSFRIQKAGSECFYCAESKIYTCDSNWYDSWFDKDNDKAYSFILRNYFDKLENDPYFTNEMKYCFLKNLPYDNAFYSGLKNTKRNGRPILLVSHELSLTGAPIALHHAAKTILANGDYPVVVSPYDGKLRNELIADGIDVIIDPSMNGSDFWLKWGRSFEMIIVNTLVQYHTINQFNNTSTPVVWWVHESKESYIRGADRLIPNEVGSNIHIYCAGQYAINALHQYRPLYKAEELLYCVPDYANDKNKDLKYKLENIQEKLVFLTIGTIEKRKGQDIFAKAIMALPADYIRKCQFIIIGRKIDENIYSEVINLKTHFPEEVTLIDEVSRNEIRDIYSQSHVIVCASRDDPMPVFMTECFIFSKVAICSENTGTASLLKDGLNGFVYQNDDFTILKEKIMYVIDNYNNLNGVKEEGRKTYERYFTDKAFDVRITGIINSILDEVNNERI